MQQFNCLTKETKKNIGFRKKVSGETFFLPKISSELLFCKKKKKYRNFCKNGQNALALLNQVSFLGGFLGV